ncbi:hypothetical protein C5S31_06885 [ANME-1 cluster archaeon GoMg2]|nr:hypothetical protein [ANME-1 cluster archaeon GoMg2]
MNMQMFFREIWNDNVEFIRHLLGDTIKILLTIVSLKIIITSVGLLFTEKPAIIEYMENSIIYWHINNFYNLCNIRCLFYH